MDGFLTRACLVQTGQDISDCQIWISLNVLIKFVLLFNCQEGHWQSGIFTMAARKFFSRDVNIQIGRLVVVVNANKIALSIRLYVLFGP